MNIGVFAVTTNPGLTLTCAILAAVTSTLLLGDKIKPMLDQATTQLQQAEKHYQSLHKRWEQDATAARFTTKLEALRSQKAQYEGLPQARQRKLQQLEAERRERQLQRHLDTFRIEHAEVSGIGPGRVATLQSYEIETAADVTEAGIEAVPGFGPALTGRLLDWRRSVEARFVYNPGQAIDPKDIARVEHEITAERVRLEQALRDGPAALRQISQQILAARESLRPALEAAAQATAQAEANLRALKRF